MKPKQTRRSRKPPLTKEVLFAQLKAKERNGRPPKQFLAYVDIGISDAQWTGLSLHIIDAYLKKPSRLNYAYVTVDIVVPFNIEKLPFVRGKTIHSEHKGNCWVKVVRYSAYKILNWLYTRGKCSFNSRQLITAISSAKHELRGMLNEIETFVPAQVAQNVTEKIEKENEKPVDTENDISDNGVIEA